MGFSPFHWLILLVPLIVAAVVLVIVMRRPRTGDLIAPPKTVARLVPSDPASSRSAPLATSAPEINLPEDVAMKVWVELRLGKLINAIKLVHDATDLNLKDSKALVDDMQRRDSDLR